MHAGWREGLGPPLCFFLSRRRGEEGRGVGAGRERAASLSRHCCTFSFPLLSTRPATDVAQSPQTAHAHTCASTPRASAHVRRVREGHAASHRPSLSLNLLLHQKINGRRPARRQPGPRRLRDGRGGQHAPGRVARGEEKREKRGGGEGRARGIPAPFFPFFLNPLPPSTSTPQHSARPRPPPPRPSPTTTRPGSPSTRPKYLR